MATVREYRLLRGSGTPGATAWSLTTHTYRTPLVASCGALAVPSAGAREGSALAALLVRSACFVECAGGEPVAEQKICFTPATLYRAAYRLSNLRSALQSPILATIDEGR